MFFKPCVVAHGVILSSEHCSALHSEQSCFSLDKISKRTETNVGSIYLRNFCMCGWILWGFPCVYNPSKRTGCLRRQEMWSMCSITIVNSLNALVALFPLLQMRMRVYFLIREQRFKYDCHEWLTWQHGKGEWVHPKFHFCILWSTRCGSRTSDVSPLLSSVFPLCSGGHYNGDNHGVTDMYGKYTQHELDLIANVTHKQCAVTVMHALRRETRHWNGKETFALNPLS